jgi:2-polyprenyl-3-methyl-5-hydroxy-6-metoxy-1,4-benzoquinol methylase
MTGCCDPRGCDDMFGPGYARHLAARYRKRGLDRTAQRIVDYLSQHGLEGMSVLEIGGGIGDVQIELLRRGAERTTNLELVDAYEPAAGELADAAGVRERMTRRLLDLAATPDRVESHDIVVLHRVVCCYPDYERLLTAAADRAKRTLVFSHPPRNAFTRTLAAGQHLGSRLTGRSFRVYTHPPAAMVAVAEGRALHAAYRHRGAIWRIVALHRASS